jgi:hypothetical protein
MRNLRPRPGLSLKEAMPDMSDDRGDREYDLITFVLAGVLAVIVLGAIGYGIFNSSRVTTAIPLGSHPIPSPASTTGTH